MNTLIPTVTDLLTWNSYLIPSCIAVAFVMAASILALDWIERRRQAQWWQR